MGYKLRTYAEGDRYQIRIESKFNPVAAVLFAILPLLTLAGTVTGVMAIINGGKGIMLLLFTAIMPFAFIHLSRLWLWNTGGSEQIVVEKDKVKVTYDYRLWKDAKEFEVIKEPRWQFETRDDSRKGKRGRIVFYGLEEDFATTILISEEDFSAQTAENRLPDYMDGIIDSQLPSS